MKFDFFKRRGGRAADDGRQTSHPIRNGWQTDARGRDDVFVAIHDGAIGTSRPTGGGWQGGECGRESALVAVGGAIADDRQQTSRPTMCHGHAARPTSGIALVITLIMLSVTLIMAVAFLAVARREKAAVAISADAANARHGADIALAAAEAQILANVMGSSNGYYNSSLLVSTNYINPFGYIFNLTPANNPTNVNFDYRSDNQPFTAADRIQDIANLLFLPRAPVMVSSTETNGRYYLDLNRNGRFENTGPFIPDINQAGLVNLDGNGNPSFEPEVGDPQWVGVLERPDTAHAPDNKFTLRYAYMVVPVGNSLDINHIHDQAVTKTVNNASGPIANDGFMRNQGVGSWEINLAAFLADLNTNEWMTNSTPFTPYPLADYAYNEPLGINQGVDFDDARALLSYRYAFNYGNLARATAVFGLGPANSVYPQDNIDEYSDGPLQTNTTNISESVVLNRDVPSFSWPGADNPNQFFTPADFYDRTKTQFGFAPTLPGFTDRLMNAGTNTFNNATNIVPTYDRYTFYRMMSELGTDSGADDVGKLDLNYDNTDGHGNIIPNAQTNLVPWTAAAFFTNAADRMLRVYTTNWFQTAPSNYLATYYGIIWTNYIDAYTGYGFTNAVLGTNMVPAFGITNIPVLIGGVKIYSPAVNRILQLAANIYDASTNSFYPSVFRPSFFKDNNGNVFINGYNQIFAPVVPGTVPLDQPIDISVLATGYTSGFENLTFRNVYGIPWIIGAKKYLPNFNQFYMQNTMQLTRKVQVNRKQVEGWNSKTTSADFSTNQLFIMSITNHVGYSFWNSYQTNYPGGVPQIYTHDIVQMILTNGNGGVYFNFATNLFYFTNFSTVAGATWPGAQWPLYLVPGSRQPQAASFFHSEGDFLFMSPMRYSLANDAFFQLPNGAGGASFDTNDASIQNLPQLGLVTSNFFQAYMVDVDGSGSGHVIDYVEFDGPSGTRSVNDELFDHYPGANSPTPNGYDMWYTNASGASFNGANFGLYNQINVSQSGLNYPLGAWKAPPNMPSGLNSGSTAQVIANEAKFFEAFFAPGSFTYNGQVYSNTNLSQQAPFTPTRTMAQITLWQANDPLVHYLASDLNDVNLFTGIVKSDDPSSAAQPIPSVSQSAVGQSSANSVEDDRYQPWGVADQLRLLPNVDTNVYNMAYRDPLVYGSDNWDFPTNRYPNVGWLGRVHRGTPWQTVYLKATNIVQYLDTGIPANGFVTWTNWLGDGNPFDARNSIPATDSRLFDVFTTALSDNASRGTLSVNQNHLAAWSALLTGLNVISNSTPPLPTWSLPPQQTSMTILPAGVDTNSPVYQMVNGPYGINQTRGQTGMFPNGEFVRAGDILRVPALSDRSPFLDLTNTPAAYDISDEMYERIPQQIMGLVQSGSPRYVIYCYGQALRPADGGTVLNANFFGLVTNYQVVAESAARAVVEIQPQVQLSFPNGTAGNPVPVTNYTARVLNYNVLGPE